MKFKSKSLTENPAIAKQLIQFCGNNRFIIVDGEMGAGKTTLITDLVKYLGVEEDITSPTFSIVNEYDSLTNGTIYHFDFYRIDSEEEAFDFGIEEYFDSGNYCFIEWAEKIQNLLPLNYVRINISVLEETRNIDIEHVTV